MPTGVANLFITSASLSRRHNSHCGPCRGRNRDGVKGQAGVETNVAGASDSGPCPGVLDPSPAALQSTPRTKVSWGPFLSAGATSLRSGERCAGAVASHSWPGPLSISPLSPRWRLWFSIRGRSRQRDLPPLAALARGPRALHAPPRGRAGVDRAEFGEHLVGYDAPEDLDRAPPGSARPAGSRALSSPSSFCEVQLHFGLAQISAPARRTRDKRQRLGGARLVVDILTRTARSANPWCPG